MIHSMYASEYIFYIRINLCYRHPSNCSLANILLNGDFNFHFNKSRLSLMNLNISLNLVQYVNGPTQTSGNMLDLVVSSRI